MRIIKRWMSRQLIRLFIRALEHNEGGVRVQFLKALRLKQPGTF